MTWRQALNVRSASSAPRSAASSTPAPLKDAINEAMRDCDQRRRHLLPARVGAGPTSVSLMVRELIGDRREARAQMLIAVARDIVASAEEQRLAFRRVYRRSRRPPHRGGGRRWRHRAGRPPRICGGDAGVLQHPTSCCRTRTAARFTHSISAGLDYGRRPRARMASFDRLTECACRRRGGARGAQPLARPEGILPALESAARSPTPRSRADARALGHVPPTLGAR